MSVYFSLIIPVFNRPNEIDELLHSITQQTYSEAFEVVIMEDGSTEKSDSIVVKYRDKLLIKYLFKPNTGAGLSRNLGMKNATGNYFIILDSDVLLPPTYLEVVSKHLKQNYTDAFGGPDAAHPSFSDLQKAINYSMTAMLTTGGLRGNKKSHAKFQPRSFNMGISKKAFKETKGFSNRKIGEDIELSFRLWEKGFKTQLIADAFVYHKRRINFGQFFRQTFNFGKERPILNKQFKGSAKLTYWFPSIFVLGIFVAIVFSFFSCFLPLVILGVYLLTIFVDSSFKNKSISIGFLSVLATIIQFFGYGLGFITSYFK